jgi:hypothetical protein
MLKNLENKLAKIQSHANTLKAGVNRESAYTTRGAMHALKQNIETSAANMKGENALKAANILNKAEKILRNVGASHP